MSKKNKDIIKTKLDKLIENGHKEITTKEELEEYNEESNEDEIDNKLTIEEVENKLDEKIPEYNGFDENHPMKGVTLENINRYKIQYGNIKSHAKNISNACKKIFENLDVKNKILNTININKNIISSSEESLQIIEYTYKSKKYYDILHIIYNLGLKKSCINQKYNLFSKKIKYYLWHKNKYDGYICRELISYNTVKEIIHCTRTNKVISLTKLLNIDIFDTIKPTKEMIYINQIIKVFNKEKYITQQNIGKYKIDLYFPKYKLIIECDEFNHKDRNKKYELERQNFIKDELNATFIRFNPDDNNFNILDVISKIHYHICNYKKI